MRILFLLLLSGCALVGSGLDTVGDKFVEQLTDYCAQPLYRREALYILVNGALDPQNIEVAIICPGDLVE